MGRGGGGGGLDSVSMPMGLRGDLNIFTSQKGDELKGLQSKLWGGGGGRHGSFNILTRQTLNGGHIEILVSTYRLFCIELSTCSKEAFVRYFLYTRDMLTIVLAKLGLFLQIKRTVVKD
jgi:hypothetical protein